ncbi:MAG: dihydrodipicolinate synthase family protein, partial [Christensenellaceae bacterium]
MIFKGSGVAICTPFTQNGINFDTFEKLIEFQIANDTDAIIVCGTTGEPSTMTDDEQASLIQFAVKTVDKRIPVIAGIGGNNTAHVIHCAKVAQDLGADGLLGVTPYYNKCTNAGL